MQQPGRAPAPPSQPRRALRSASGVEESKETIVTKKDYQLIADVVKTIVDKETRRVVCDAFIIKLGNQNPRFSSMAFEVACDLPVRLGRTA
jgi:hypothetical protein